MGTGVRHNSCRPCVAVILPSRDAIAYRRCANLARQVAARGWDVLTVEPSPAKTAGLRETGLEQGVRQFDQFFRSSRSHECQSQGTGLGLAITSRLWSVTAAEIANRTSA